MNKKWLIGCGGCMGLLLILALVLGGLGWWGYNAYMGSSKEALAEIFGDTPPAGYQPLIGLKLPDSDNPGESMPMTLLINPTGKTMVFAMKTRFTPEQMALLQSDDAAQLGTLIQQAMESTKNADASGDLTVHQVVELDTAKGPVRALQASIASKRGRVPLIGAFIPQATGQHVKILALMSPGSQSANPDASFEEEFGWMTTQLTQVISESGIMAANTPASEPAAAH